MSDEALRKRALRAGIAPSWHDFRGQPHEVSPQTLHALLEALGFRDAGDVAEDGHADDADWHAAPLLTADAGATCVVPGIHRGSGLVLEAEDGARLELRSEADPRGLRITAPARPGYYRFERGTHPCTLAVAPPHCTAIADACGAGARPWGIAAQLYSLAERGDMGLASYATLARFAEAAAGHGADAVAVSPVHAMFSADPGRRSPYGPSSRLFLNVLHVDPAEASGSAAVAAALAAMGGEAAARHLESLPLLDWPTAGSLRLGLLRELAPMLLADPRREAAFQVFRRSHGEALESHARFDMLHARLGGSGWQDWPAELRDPASAAVQRLAAQHAGEVAFHALLQFLAAEQRAAAQQRACAAGMRIGLVTDLAIGADPGGSHAWARQDEMLAGVTVGAPPDQLAPHGQAWGIAAFSPTALRRSGFRGFIELLRACMAASGGMRVDHVMGMQRLWLIPPGGDSADGAYVAYPLEDLLRLLRLESWRQRCLVVGEDLGTVDPALRARLADAGALGMSVLYFEQDQGRFLPPTEWRRRSVAMTSTHDLPTLAGWWEGRDLALREALHPSDAATRAAGEEGRAQERASLWRAMQASGHATGDPPGTDDPQDRNRFVDCAIAHTASAAAELALVPLEDVLGTPEAPNLPGTVDEHPNWRRRLPSPVSAELDRAPVAARLRRLRAARGPA